MPSFSVNVNVGEVVDGLDNVIEEVKERYLSYAIIGVSALLVAILIASCVGATCGFCSYYFCCERRRHRRRKKRRLNKNNYIKADV